MRDKRLRDRILYLLRSGHAVDDVVVRTRASRSTVYRLRRDIARDLERRRRLRLEAEVTASAEEEMERMRSELRRLGQELRDLRKRERWQRRAGALAYALGELVPYSVWTALRSEGALTLRVVGTCRAVPTTDREFVVVCPEHHDDARVAEAVSEALSAYEDSEVLDDGDGDAVDRLVRHWREGSYTGAAGAGDS